MKTASENKERAIERRKTIFEEKVVEELAQIETSINDSVWCGGMSCKVELVYRSKTGKEVMRKLRELGYEVAIVESYNKVKISWKEAE